MNRQIEFIVKQLNSGMSQLPVDTLLYTNMGTILQLG